MRVDRRHNKWTSDGKAAQEDILSWLSGGKITLEQVKKNKSTKRKEAHA